MPCSSGSVVGAQLHRLCAGARAVVFPLVPCQGFDLRSVTTLAYGGTLLSRRSALPAGEIAGTSPCRIRAALCRSIGVKTWWSSSDGSSHHKAVRELPLGGALAGGRPKSWRDVAATITTFAGERSSDLSKPMAIPTTRSGNSSAARADAWPSGAAR